MGLSLCVRSVFVLVTDGSEGLGGASLSRARDLNILLATDGAKFETSSEDVEYEHSRHSSRTFYVLQSHICLQANTLLIACGVRPRNGNLGGGEDGVIVCGFHCNDFTALS